MRFSEGEKSCGVHEVKEKGECEVCKLCADPTSKGELNEEERGRREARQAAL